MDRNEARRRVDALITRTGGPGPEVVGILVVDADGTIGISMDSDDETDILEIGVRGRRKAGPVVARRELAAVTPTLERP